MLSLIQELFSDSDKDHYYTWIALIGFKQYPHQYGTTVPFRYIYLQANEIKRPFALQEGWRKIRRDNKVSAESL